MTVYVDEVIDYSLIAKARGLRHTHWCHLTADTQDELHAFAARLGLKRSWFQNANNYRWHYDITPPKRVHAVRMGAVEIDWRGTAALMAARRAAKQEQQVVEQFEYGTLDRARSTWTDELGHVTDLSLTWQDGEGARWRWTGKVHPTQGPWMQVVGHSDEVWPGVASMDANEPMDVVITAWGPWIPVTDKAA